MPSCQYLDSTPCVRRASNCRVPFILLRVLLSIPCNPNGSCFVKSFLTALLFILSFLPSAGLAQARQPVGAAATAVKPAYEIPIVTKTLANGLEIIVLPDSSVPLVTVEDRKNIG